MFEKPRRLWTRGGPVCVATIIAAWILAAGAGAQEIPYRTGEWSADSLGNHRVVVSVDDAAEALGISRATAYRHWTYARAWVRAELLDENSGKNRSES